MSDSSSSNSTTPQVASSRAPYYATGFILLLLIVIGGAVSSDWLSATPPNTKKHYVGSQSCMKCHQSQHAEWKGTNAKNGSDHYQAMEVASDETVLGNFDNYTYEHYKVKTRFFRKDNQFWVTTEGRKGEMETMRIRYTFGVRPLQQYLVAFPEDESSAGEQAEAENLAKEKSTETTNTDANNAAEINNDNKFVEPRLQALPVAWNTEKNEWFLLDPEDEYIAPNDILHWTGRAMNWNHMCADCHSTNLQKNYDLETNQYHTSFAEVNVSCESCHGPGSLHVELANSNSLFWDRNHGYGLIKMKRQSIAPDPHDKTYITQIETCAKCHSRRHVIYPDGKPGEPFLDHYIPELLDSDVYHVDGQIRPEEEAYVYGSFLQSKMYRKGVRCSDCHNPHTAKVYHEGNQLCAKCHQPAKYDTPGHHHHPVMSNGKSSKGASCVECHMPATTYMEIDPRRDHSIRIPRPDLTVELKTPNACNGCHKKKEETPEWAAKKIEEWYGKKQRPQKHFAHAIAAGRLGEASAEKELISLGQYHSEERDPGPLVRASAVALLGRYLTEQSTQALLSATKDREALVRTAAVRSLEMRPVKVEAVTPLLTDPIRSVRIGAAQVLSHFPQDQLPIDSLKSYHAALEEFRTGLLAQADQPGAHYGLGLLEERLSGDPMSYYEEALRIDPYFQVARVRLASMYQQQGKFKEAEALLRTGIENVPVNSEDRYVADSHYMLGLLLRELPGRKKEAAEQLQKAVELAPGEARYLMNYGWTLKEVGKLKEAEEVLIQAQKLDPENIDISHAIVLLYQSQERWQELLNGAIYLQRHRPQEVGFWLLRATAEFHLGRTDEALQLLNSIVQQQPRLGEAWYMLALCYEKKEQWQEAYQAAGKAMQFDPQNPKIQAFIQRLQQGK